MFHLDGFSFANERFQRMTIKTILATVLAVAVGGAALGFASKYRSDCCGNGASKGVVSTAISSNASMVSLNGECPVGECSGSCSDGDVAGGKACCQAAALSKATAAKTEGEGHEDECSGNCSAGTASAGKECCQGAEKANAILGVSKVK